MGWLLTEQPRTWHHGFLLLLELVSEASYDMMMVLFEIGRGRGIKKQDLIDLISWEIFVYDRKSMGWVGFLVIIYVV